MSFLTVGLRSLIRSAAFGERRSLSVVTPSNRSVRLIQSAELLRDVLRASCCFDEATGAEREYVQSAHSDVVDSFGCWLPLSLIVVR